jgi:hypothetical protein
MTLFNALVAMALSLMLLLTAPGVDASSSAGQQFLSEGDPLQALAFRGAVDAADIPNSTANSVPGAFVVLRWRDVSLQLPRTNNAGVPRYSDGRWWWQARDPDHLEFAQLGGTVERYRCERQY